MNDQQALASSLKRGIQPMHDARRTGLSRRTFIYLSGLAALALGRAGNTQTPPAAPAATADEWNALLAESRRFPLFDALFGRRSRRFGWGMEIPHGPLAYKSELPPVPLDDF